MRFSERTLWITISLLLPLLYFGTCYFFVTASVALAETDRAIVWAEGDPAQLQSLSRRVVTSGQFQDGRVSPADARLPIPETCGAGAREFSIGSLKAEEAQAARALLESLAVEAGARICRTDVFMINELPSLSPQRGWSFWSATLLQTLLLPLGIVAAIFLAFSGPLQLRALAGQGSSARAQSGLGLLGAFASLGALLLLQGTGALAGFDTPQLPGFSVQALGLALTFALVVAVPAMEALVFLGWMLPLSERAIGTWPAAALTALAFAASRLPATFAEGLLQLAVGAILVVIYARSRSLWAGFLANALFNALAFLPMDV